jgi:hypothetical protein
VLTSFSAFEVALYSFPRRNHSVNSIDSDFSSSSSSRSVSDEKSLAIESTPESKSESDFNFTSVITGHSTGIVLVREVESMVVVIHLALDFHHH